MTIKRAPGWYPDPARPTTYEVFWDGAAWTSRRRPTQAAAPPGRRAGWYHDVGWIGFERWWDGEEWTDRRRPASQTTEGARRGAARAFGGSEPRTRSGAGSRARRVAKRAGRLGLALSVCVAVGIAGLAVYHEGDLVAATAHLRRLAGHAVDAAAADAPGAPTLELDGWVDEPFAFELNGFHYVIGVTEVAVGPDEGLYPEPADFVGARLTARIQNASERRAPMPFAQVMLTTPKAVLPPDVETPCPAYYPVPSSACPISPAVDTPLLEGLPELGPDEAYDFEIRSDTSLPGDGAFELVALVFIHGLPADDPNAPTVIHIPLGDAREHK